jgi:membrane protein
MSGPKPAPDSQTRYPKLAGAWGFLAEIYREWAQDRAVTLGAALAFYTTFSMAPLLIIVIAVFGMILGETTVQEEIVRRVNDLVGPQGAHAVTMMIRGAYRPGAGLPATIIGLTVIVIGSTSAFVMLQQALNLMWGARVNRKSSVWHFVRERLLSFVMIMVIGIFLVLSFILSIVLSFVTGFFQNLLPVPPFLIQASDFCLSLGLITILFAVVYKILPEVKIAWADVWVGASITAILFTLGKFLFAMYLSHSSIRSAYGAASSLAVFLMWVYYSAQVFFIGAEATQVYANRYGSRVKPRT